MTEQAATPTSELTEIEQTISTDTSSVELKCPECGAQNEHSATSWPKINPDGVFIVSPVVTYGVTCTACNGDFLFKPHSV